MTPESALQLWLYQRLDAAGTAWLRDAVAGLTGGGAERDIERDIERNTDHNTDRNTERNADRNTERNTERNLYRCVSLVSRKLGKAPLALDAAALAVAAQSRPGWNPSAWTVDQAARVLLLLAATADSDTFVRRLDQLCATADVDELVAFYRGLPLYPDPSRHRLRAAEGVRSNMRVVFEAVAHDNPYPAEQLPEDAWNQMVLKTLFVGSRLAPIVGLDERANPTLARMLSDYAHERWAARRPFNPELWRCVGPFASGPQLDDLARVLNEGTAPDRAAAVLALRSASDPDARRLLDRHAALRDTVTARGLNWTSVLDFH